MTCDAWPDWHDALVRRWYAMARRTLGVRHADVDDVVHETVSRVLQRHRAQPFPSVDDAARWGTTVLANLVRGSWRTARRHPSIPFEELSECALGTARAADELAADRELTVELTRLVGGLPPADQAILRARFADGLSYADAAAHLGIGVSAYGVRLHRLVRGLRARLSTAGVAIALFLPRTRRHLTRTAVVAAPTLAVAFCLGVASAPRPALGIEAGEAQVGGPMGHAPEAGSSVSAGSGDPARPRPTTQRGAVTPPAPRVIPPPRDGVVSGNDTNVCHRRFCIDLALEETDAAMDEVIRSIPRKIEEAAATVEEPPLP